MPVRFRIILLFLFILNGFACKDIDVFTEPLEFYEDTSTNQDPPQNPTNQFLVKSELLRTYTVQDLQTSISLLLPNLTLTSGVSVYKITYKTTDPFDEVTIASGLVGIPFETNQALPIMNWNHGTVFLKNDIPSNLNQESLVGLAFSGIGYISVLPDYLGYGESDLDFHPYLHYVSTAKSIEDMILAAAELAANLNLILDGRVYTSGYSEGGYASMAFQKYLENDSTRTFRLNGVYPMAGPYDLVATGNSFLENKTYENPAFISFLFHSFNKILELDNLNTVFNEPFNGKISDLHNLNNSQLSIDEINAQLSLDINSLFKPEFLSSWQDGSNSYIDIFEENSVYQYLPRVPLVMIHCDEDDIVPYENAIIAKEFFDENNAPQTELVTLEGNDHGECFLPAIQELFRRIKN